MTRQEKKSWKKGSKHNEQSEGGNRLPVQREGTARSNVSMSSVGSPMSEWLASRRPRRLT